MKSYIFKKVVLSALLLMCLLAIEVVTFRFLTHTNLPTYWYIDIGVFLLISVFVFLLPFIVQVIISNLMLIIHALLCVTNLILFKSSGRCFDWSMLKLLSETAEVESMVVVPAKQVIFIVGVVLFFLAVSIILKIKQKKKHYPRFVHNFLYILALGVVASIIVLESFVPYAILKKYDKETYFTSDSFMFSTFESSIASLNAFGFWGYYFNSLVRQVFPETTPELKATASLYSEDCTSVLEGMCEGDNVIFILAESFENYVISKATTPVLYALQNGIDLSECGISKFYDVSTDEISGQYKLKRKDFNDDLTFNGTDIFAGTTEGEVGLVLNNYKSIESTDNSEKRALTGSISKVVDESTLPQMFNSQNYTTSYVHGNYKSFYARGSYIKESFEFDNVLFYDEMEGKIENSGDLSFFLKDRDVVNYCLNHKDEFGIISDEHFFTYMLTVATHGNYDIVDDTRELIDEYLKKFEAYKNAYPNDEIIGLLELCENETLKYHINNFMASAIDTEEAVALLIHELKVQNRLDNTVLVFVADHYASANGIVEYKENYIKHSENKATVREVDIHTLPAFIYSTKIKNDELTSMGYGREISHLTSAFDLAPTILTLAGIDFNPAHYFGYPVINKSTVTGELVKNDAVYSSTYGYFYDETLMGITGLEDDKNYAGKDLEHKKKIQDYINEFYSKKYYMLEMEKRGWFE